MDGGLVGDTPVLQRDVVAKLGQRSGPAIVGVLRNLELSCKRLQMPMCRLDPSGQKDPTSGQVGICMIFLDSSEYFACGFFAARTCFLVCKEHLTHLNNSVRKIFQGIRHSLCHDECLGFYPLERRFAL